MQKAVFIEITFQGEDGKCSKVTFSSEDFMARFDGPLYRAELNMAREMLGLVDRNLYQVKPGVSSLAGKGE